MEKFVKIPLNEWIKHQRDLDFLLFLESCGVDNWDPGVDFDTWMYENQYAEASEETCTYPIIEE